MKKFYTCVLILVFGVLSSSLIAQESMNILVFSKTAGFRHGSISNGIAALRGLGENNGASIEFTESSLEFTSDNLDNYNVIVFLNTTGDILNDSQQDAMQAWYRAGGGFVGIHSAADTEYNWPWYNQLLGAWFNGHPQIQEANMEVVDSTHISIGHLARQWRRRDEWYNYRSVQDHIQVLINLDESSYQGGTMGNNHPISWYHEFEGGRTFYTGMGHTAGSYSEPDFLQHIWGGITYVAAAGEEEPVEVPVKPSDQQFSKITLDEGLNEPMELAALPDGNILFIERKGAVKLYNFSTETTEVVGNLSVYSGQEDGLLGIAIDPNFEQNSWIYLMYSPTGEEDKQHVSRFIFSNSSLDLASEQIVIEIPTQRDECCHSAGSLEFDPSGNLLISTGDDTNPFDSNGFAPIDERVNRQPWDAQRTAANTEDLRGKILRITPQDDGSYTIPTGNLFPNDGSEGRPEIYIMGCRNPFRMSIDSQNGYLYWGDVGPDANDLNPNRGPAGHDEINQARSAGFFGWPYFVGDNKAYIDFNFQTQTSGTAFNASSPSNTSANNTGTTTLPPAQGAFIWYPYGPSAEFPQVGQGGRNAMAGPIFYTEDYPETAARFPAYYDGKMFIYEWMRGWIMAVSFTENGQYESMEPFLPGTTFTRPMDMIMGPAGDMFLLEYGSNWFIQNDDARLVHIQFSPSTVSNRFSLVEELGLIVYPNPVYHTLAISAKEPLRELRVYTLEGKSVLRKTVNLSELDIDLSQLPDGMYILHLSYDRGKVVEKLLKRTD
ncbi:MAG: ThuA domain-containing protein [Bacteroidota bacterium]